MGCELESRDTGIVGLANVSAVYNHLFDQSEVAVEGCVMNGGHTLLLLVLLVEPLHQGVGVLSCVRSRRLLHLIH